MTDKVETAKAAAKPKAKAANAPLAIALHRINGTIEPGTPLGLSSKHYDELLELEAIRPANESEIALYDKVGGVATLEGDADPAAALD